MDIFLATLFLVTCVLLIIVVLLQKGRGGGIGAAFGGAGGGSAFGTRTGDVFTWVTIVLTALFLLLAIGTTFAFRPKPGTVATPTFTPAAAPIEEAVMVTMESKTPDAEIYYTLDGSQPSKDSSQSLLYQGQAVRVSPGATLKATGYRPRWKPSATAIGEYLSASEQPEAAAETSEAADEAETVEESPAPAEQPAE